MPSVMNTTCANLSRFKFQSLSSCCSVPLGRVLPEGEAGRRRRSSSRSRSFDRGPARGPQGAGGPPPQGDRGTPRGIGDPAGTATWGPGITTEAAVGRGSVKGPGVTGEARGDPPLGRRSWDRSPPRRGARGGRGRRGVSV